MARHNRVKNKLKQRTQTTKAYKSSPAHMHTPPEHVPTQGTNRSDRFSKPVTSVPKTGQTDLTWQKLTPKAKNAKEMYMLPLDYWDRF
jgi:hypothetical protein